MKWNEHWCTLKFIQTSKRSPGNITRVSCKTSHKIDQDLPHPAKHLSLQLSTASYTTKRLKSPIATFEGSLTGVVRVGNRVRERNRQIEKDTHTHKQKVWRVISVKKISWNRIE